MAAGGPGNSWEQALAAISAQINARFDELSHEIGALRIELQGLSVRVQSLEVVVFPPPPAGQNQILQGTAAGVVNVNPVAVVQVAVGQPAPAILPPEEAEQ